MSATANERKAPTLGGFGAAIAKRVTESRWLDSAWRRWLAGALALLAFALVVIVPLDLRQQMLFFVASFIVGWILARRQNKLITLILMLLSVSASLRYMYWRLTTTVGFNEPFDMFFGWGLAGAELYALLLLLLGYWQTAWPLQRKPVVLDGNVAAWPTADVFIPTYNEPLSVVRKTVLAAMQLDWPADKLRVCLLDDGTREEFRQFCEKVGCEYFTRDNNRHAKAGNINEALARTHGEFVTIFDCDHVPTRSFLQICLGWFRKDLKLAMLQTPHLFFSPDPFEKNLHTFRKVPNEGELFYGLVQDGNDLWNASFFCGSCAVMRRSALDDVGGIATGSVTEDALTALKMARKGWNTAYLSVPQAAGQATESISGHVGQRIRWARGMAQIFRTNNPLLGNGLTLSQRICYFSASVHFFNGLPRIVFLTAPLSYLYFGAHVFQASAPLIIAYALPHLMLASLTNSHIQGGVRYSFWNEVYETVLAWFIAWPTLVALFMPTRGKFNVTVKGGVIEREYFDWEVARPYLIILALNLIGIVAGVFRLFHNLQFDQIGTIIINTVWTVYNVIFLGAGVAVAMESRQVRKEPRVPADVDIAGSITLTDGRMLACRTIDFSTGGAGVRLSGIVPLEKEELVQVSFFGKTDDEAIFQARVVHVNGMHVGLRFDEMSLAQESQLVRMTYSRADLWLRWTASQNRDSPLAAFGSIARLSWHGMWVLAQQLTGITRSRLTKWKRRKIDVSGFNFTGVNK